MILIILRPADVVDLFVAFGLFSLVDEERT